ncbi:MAG TPA: DUF3090 family protein [Candidatus Limnocylindrales bacterium]|nr:DUF3090 family protein [Candidatus Limnocylindrales bacterium]
MPSQSFEFERVTRVTAGAVGTPGKRSFFLQVRAGTQLVSLAMEKQQLQLLADRLQQLLSTVSVPEGALIGDLALEEPLHEAWRIGSMTLAYDEADRLFEVTLVELTAEGDEPATGRFLAEAGQMQALAQHAIAVVAAGRPPCPMCGGPSDHNGGICPRLNGHHA